MDDYSQPSFYHFNQDSLHLVKYVLSQNLQSQRILDLGAGCGIIGIELARILRPSHLVLLELQDQYRRCLNENLREFIPPGVSTEIVINSFSQYHPAYDFDLIVCNPPYYLPGHGQPSSDDRRGLARSFIRDDWKILLDLIRLCLSRDGRAFVVVKDDSRILQQVEKHSNRLSLIYKKARGIVLIEISHSV